MEQDASQSGTEPLESKRKLFDDGKREARKSDFLLFSFCVPYVCVF